MKIWSKNQLEFLKLNRDFIDDLYDYSEWYKFFVLENGSSGIFLYSEKIAINLAMALKLNGEKSIYFELKPVFSRYVKGTSKCKRKDFKKEFLGVEKKLKVYSCRTGLDYDLYEVREGDSKTEYVLKYEKLQNLEDLHDEGLVRDFLIDGVLGVLADPPPWGIGPDKLELYFLKDLKIKIKVDF